jgi:hypothetical protein
MSLATYFAIFSRVAWVVFGVAPTAGCSAALLTIGSGSGFGWLALGGGTGTGRTPPVGGAEIGFGAVVAACVTAGGAPGALTD